jgi:hypothetical protein
MSDGGITANFDASELIGVLWTTFFHTNGVAFHGTFWHDNFGIPMSHGCVNMRNPDTLWLFRSCAPAYEAEMGFRSGRTLVSAGTRITITGSQIGG